MRYLFTFLLCASAAALCAQSDDELEKIAQVTCDCVAKKNPDLKNKSETELALGLCMMDAAQASGLKIDMTNPQAMEEMGQKVGIRMAAKCPNIFTAFIEEEQDSATPEYIELAGRIKSVEATDFTTVVLREDTGKEHRLLWIHYFPGSDPFTADPKQMVGKSVTITYSMVEVYVPKTKGYVSHKQIFGLKEN